MRLFRKIFNFNLRGTSDSKRDLDEYKSNKYYSNDDSTILIELKEALCDSFSSETNDLKIFYQNVNFTILSKVFYDFKINSCINKVFDDSLLNYIETKRYYFSLENLKNQLINDFHSKLNQCIEHCLHYHKKSFYKNIFYKKKHYDIVEKDEEKLLYDLYDIAIKEIEIGFDQITYNIENVNKNTYNYIHLSFINNINNSTRHKRYNHIQAKKELFRIKKIENGTPNKTYYPFYFQTKKDLLKLTQEKSYVFLLETKEINLLINEILIICKNEINKSEINKNELNEDLKLFFSNQLDISINTLLFIKNKKVLNYLFYKLDKKGKCNTNILFSQIKILNKTKYLPIKHFNSDVKKFNKNNALPKQYKLIDNVIKLISQN